MRIGICEDDLSIRKVLTRALEQAGHTVVAAHTGSEAIALLGPDADLDVLVMDIGLPDADGRDVVPALRSAGQHAPVLFLTALSATHELLGAFAAGADDYVVKPFEIKEVLARVQALALRGRPPAAPSDGLVLDPTAHSARAPGGRVLLTPTEFRMLASITSRPGDVVRRRSVVAAGWPDGSQVSENTIDSFMRRIRRKLATISAPVEIETVRGVGFRMAEREP
ncbi:MAG: response regulator transcription factor [Nocardioidaceae bacterium]|nr:response regulator transcription factor [Nocardioidaceae bacterium]MCL2612643.1 response regulator transcription factor [Nocardioidaceae bacterium]